MKFFENSMNLKWFRWTYYQKFNEFDNDHEINSLNLIEISINVNKFQLKCFKSSLMTTWNKIAELSMFEKI